MNYEVVTLKEKIVVGTCARTGNDDPDCVKIIGGLWQKFMAEGIWESIENKANTYCIGLYSDYDETSYDVTVGCEVLENSNPKLTEKRISAGQYAVFHVKGDVVKAVSEAWGKIWDMPLDRSFSGDFEEYLSNDNGVAEINIYIALK
ncbi:AraC family transcriptional regulator [Aminipila butyrica]|uniref:AraC family transcriptional regulator n=1 Tax=Aminipila butyrica TaxID=433296 RepID=A0A858BWL4_9FIRM|nr:GyrI-like domain-containing protein [Aminipila butyrica]QIB70323.1 AraC family transcriptional regulator [Aminipila butyrica]